MRTTVLCALCVIVFGGMLVRANADETREARIHRLPQEALTLRKQGRLDEVKQQLAQAEQKLAGATTGAASDLTPGGPGAASHKNTVAETDPAKAFARGLAAMAAKDLDTAQKEFQTVVRLDPNSFEAHNNLAVIYAEQGKEENALAELQAALRLRPNYYRGRKNLAELYTRLASRAYKEAAAVAPLKERETLLERGRELATLGQPSIRVTKAPAATSPQHKPAAPSKAPPAAPAAVAAAPTPATVAGAVHSVPSAAAAASVPQGERPRPLLALGQDGAYGITIDGARLWMYEQKGGAERAIRSYPVKASKTALEHGGVYVAAIEHSRINLIPLVPKARPFTLRSSESGGASVSMDANDLKFLAGIINSYLTPVLVTSRVELVKDEQDQSTRSAVAAAFQSWSESWDKKDLGRYVASYVPTYVPVGERSHDSWLHQRKRIFSLSGDVSVKHSLPVILLLDGDVLTLSKQHYRSALQVSTGVKSLTWVSTPSGWRITKEQMLSERIGSDGH